MAKAKKSSAKRATKKGKSLKAARYGISHTWKRAELVMSDYKPLPASAISDVLELTGFRDLESLCAEISKHQVYHIPSSLQKRLIELFDVDFNAVEADDPIYIKVGRKSYKLPYPFSAENTSQRKYNIADISFEENKRAGTLKIRVRMYVEIPKCLSARKKADEDFCTLMASGVDMEDATDNEKAIVSSWLSRNGMKSSDVEKVLENANGLFDDLSVQILDRIHQMLNVFGGPGLLNDEPKDTVLNEEDGYDAFV